MKKKVYWRKYCNTVGRETHVNEVWGMIKRMNGIRREHGYPILVDNGTTAITGKGKTEMLAQTFVRVHGSNNLSEEGRKGREPTLEENRCL